MPTVQLSVVRGNITRRTPSGHPYPTVRIEQVGVPDRVVHEVKIKGPSKMGPYQAGRIVVETDSPLEEILWDDPAGRTTPSP